MISTSLNPLSPGEENRDFFYDTVRGDAPLVDGGWLRGFDFR